MVKLYKQRWFVLSYDTLQLYYYRSHHEPLQRYLGVINIAAIVTLKFTDREPLVVPSGNSMLEAAKGLMCYHCY